MNKLLVLATLCGALGGGAAFAQDPRVTTGFPTAPAVAPTFTPTPGCCEMSTLPQRPTSGILGSGPLVNNVVAVGVQANVQNGEGNVGINLLNVGQGVGGATGSLVNNTLATGAQLNTQLGAQNLGANVGTFGQAVR